MPKKSQTFSVLDKRPAPKNELRRDDDKLSEQLPDPTNRYIPPSGPCTTCPDGFVNGLLITDEDEEIIYAYIDEDTLNIIPEGEQVYQNVAAQATRISGTYYSLPTNARYVRTVSVDFLFMDTGWKFEPPRYIRFQSDLDADSFVWVRYVA